MRAEPHAAGEWRSAVIPRIDALDPAAWNALVRDRNPFLRHEFLAALERHGCVGEHYGWIPHHLALFDAQGRLRAALPQYVKHNSYGELVFDWSWAEAWQRAGLRYYPKLVAAVPYTPATGQRLLVAADDREIGTLRARLIEAAIEEASRLGVSSLHWLFPHETDREALAAAGLPLRLGCQFHWQNRGDADFAAFLARFQSARRKKINQERRYVREAGVALEILHGPDIDSALWHTIHGFYCSTFERKSGMPTLSLDFFEEVGRTLGGDVVVVLARAAGKPVAAAINFRSADTLYGRHWGCAEQYNALHFEACYYQGIDYCIAQGLARFEPGAQGEHKIARGFDPTPTWSAHWIDAPQFRAAIADFCRREQGAVTAYMDELGAHAPYRRDAP